MIQQFQFLVYIQRKLSKLLMKTVHNHRTIIHISQDRQTDSAMDKGIREGACACSDLAQITLRHVELRQINQALEVEYCVNSLTNTI